VANPQPDKFTKISNEILEALARIRISGEARQVLDTILRKTYGFQKKEDIISLSQFSLATGLNQPATARAINKLKTMNLIIKKDNRKIGLQKNFDLWKPLSKKITIIKKDNFIDKKDNKPLSKKIHTKDIYTNTKDTITKDNKDTVQNKPITKRHTFIKPAPQEVTEYAKTISFTIDGQDFFDYYEARGWKYKGNVAMKDWKAAVRTWKKNQKSDNQLKPPPGKYDKFK
jgi:phage replication O-like protein O